MADITLALDCSGHKELVQCVMMTILPCLENAAHQVTSDEVMGPGQTWSTPRAHNIILVSVAALIRGTQHSELNHNQIADQYQV